MMAVIVGAAAVITWWRRSLGGDRERETARAILRKKLGYLELDEGDVERFLDDFLSDQNPHPLRSRLRRLHSGLPLYEYTDILAATSLAGRVEALEEWLVTSFLLSSDFFGNNADTTRVVHYVAFYDPYRLPCTNPFARFD